MFKYLSLVLIAGLVGISSIAEESKPIAQASNQFGFDLYGRLRSEPGNLFISPINITSALAMTAAGAQGQTLHEMLQVLHLPQGDGMTNNFASLLQQLEVDSRSPYELSLAAALWGNEGFPIQQSFLDRVNKGFGGGLKRVNFKDSVAAANIINAWVEQQTKSKIKELVTPENITPLTRLILTSAIYFKGQWQTKFTKEFTQPEPFFTSADKSTKTAMMHTTGKFRYYEDKGLQLVDLPYKGNRISMTIVLPKSKDGLATLESELSGSKITEWINKSSSQLGEVALPKFEFSVRYSLPDQLQAMGMKRAFSNGAEFGGISTAEPLKIADVIHKAFIKVDEEGSEAAAATAVIMERAPSPVADKFHFRADHPFVFMIRDNKTGTVLFLGRMSEPNK